MNRDQSKVYLPVSGLWDAVENGVDIFVCCGSYESRCRSIADVVPPNAVRKAIIAHNVNLDEYVGRNTRHLFERFGDRTVDAPTDSTKPLATADALNLALEEVAGQDSQQYLVDITTFTHEALLMLLRLLALRLRSGDRARFVYTSAAEYSVGDADDRKWLSKGVLDVRSVLGYPGEQASSFPTHLVVMVGYEHERAAGLIDVVEPERISLGYGDPGQLASRQHEAARLAFTALLRRTQGLYGPRVESFTFECDDPWDSARAVSERAHASADCNAIVAPMNTKISTIGAALAAGQDERIQLCYAQPLAYNFERYSSPGDMCYLLEIPELFART